ncbi:hypothetical protein ABVT39_023340 [Epinephelus coioides]
MNALEPHGIEITLFEGVNGERMTVTGAAPGGSHSCWEDTGHFDERVLQPIRKQGADPSCGRAHCLTNHSCRLADEPAHTEILPLPMNVWHSSEAFLTDKEPLGVS